MNSSPIKGTCGPKWPECLLDAQNVGGLVLGSFILSPILGGLGLYTDYRGSKKTTRSHHGLIHTTEPQFSLTQLAVATWERTRQMKFISTQTKLPRPQALAS